MKYGLVVLVALLFAVGLHAQVWVNYDTNDGLLSNQVNAVSVDANGIVWFGTDQGISILDGATWNSISSDQTGVGNAINAFVLETDNAASNIWVATDGGVARIGLPGASDFTPFTESNSDLVSNLVFATAIDSLNVKWFGTQNGLSSLSGTSWRSYASHLSDSHVLSIGARGAWKYVGTMGGGVSRVFNNGVDAVTSASPYDTDWSGLLSNNVYDVYVLEDGDQWFATDVGAAYHRGTETKEGWTNYVHSDILPFNNYLPDDYVTSIAEDNSGTIWFGTQNGIASYDGTDWQIFTTEDGLISNNIFDIAVDANNNIWFATGIGVSHYQRNPVSVKSQSPAQIKEFSLAQNYPNPFNPSTLISYELDKKAHVRLELFNVSGQKVRTLVSTNLQPGTHSAWWDGRDFNGQPVVSGVYIYRLSVNAGGSSFVASKKMLLIK